MADTNSSGSFPVADAGVIEGLGFIGGCDYSPYTPGQVAATAESWINAGHRTIIEISPQWSCDSNPADYESAIALTIATIAFNTTSSAFKANWGGVMLDEEPNWYTASQLEGLNSWAQGNVSGKLFSESTNWPGSGWSQADFEAILWGGAQSIQYAAPQVYNQNVASYTNQGMADGHSNVLVTCSSTASAPWNTCPYATSQINNGAWSNIFIWGNPIYYWDNKWQPA